MSTPYAAGGRAPGEFVIERAVAERVTRGSWHGREERAVVRGVAIDSRAVIRGSCFACLVGASVDGHEFAGAAVDAGAALVLAARPLPVSVPVLVVADVALALAALAAEYRRTRRDTVWIGITGSNGKTTTKELIASACAGSGKPVHLTRGNLNNHLGVPITVLATPGDAAFAVIEMGANHAGEIATLAAIAQPTVGVITSIGTAHLEGFGSLRGIAAAKSELFAALPPNAPALLGMEGMAETAQVYGVPLDHLLGEVRERAHGKRLAMIGGEASPLRGAVLDDGVRLDTDHGSVRIPLLGRHNLANATIAYQAALAAGVAPDQALRGLATVQPVAGRLRAVRAGLLSILDDSYNANPTSVVAGLKVLAAAKGERVAVLGAMGELGAARDAGHREVGAAAAKLGLPLITVGEGARAIGDGYRAAGGTQHVHVGDRATAVAAVIRHSDGRPTTVLIKASRSSGLDTVVEGLLERLGPTAPPTALTTPPSAPGG